MLSRWLALGTSYGLASGTRGVKLGIWKVAGGREDRKREVEGSMGRLWKW